MNLGSRNKIKTDGGMASMTDLVFLLLIFFIIMALMSNPTARVDVPEQNDLPPETNPIAASVVVTEDNRYVVFPGGNMDDPKAYEDIEEDAKNAVNGSGEAKLKIEGHRNADYEAVFKILAMAQINGWDPVLAYKK